MRAGWLVLAVALGTACATTPYDGYGYGHGHKAGDYDPRVGPEMSIVAKFEMGGVRGEVCFFQERPGTNVTITVKLDGLEQLAPEMFAWEIYEYPVKFGLYPDFPCADLGEIYGCIPDQPCYGALGDRLGPLDATNMVQVFQDDVLSLYGWRSPIGRSVVIRKQGSDQPWICANIEYQGISLSTLRAAFDNGGGNLNGDVIFRRANGRSGTTLNVCLNRQCNATFPEGAVLDWYLRTGSCNNYSTIGPVVGTDTHPDEIMMGAYDDCSMQEPRACPMGNLTVKCGQISPDADGKYRAFCNDDQLGLVPLSLLTDTVLVFEDENGIVDCQPWQTIHQQCARVTCVKRPRVYIDMLFFQYDPGDRTHVRSHVTGLDGTSAYLQIRENKVEDRTDCSDLGPIFDKPGPQLTGAPFAGDPTGDALPVGTLEFKISSIRGEQSLRRQDTTSWLPLFGPYNITNRALILVDENGERITCCNIEPIDDPGDDLVASVLGYQEEAPLVGVP